MLTAVGFVLIGVLWLMFRKWLARRQHQILMQMMGRSQDADPAQVDALRKIGVGIAVLLLLAGLVMLGVHLAVAG